MGRFPDEHLQALEQKRQGVADLRRFWIGKRQPFMARHLERLAFIHETSLKTNMAKTTGWAPRGQRLTDHAPAVLCQRVRLQHGGHDGGRLAFDGDGGGRGGDRTLDVIMEFRRCQSPIGHLEAVVGLGFYIRQTAKIAS